MKKGNDTATTAAVAQQLSQIAIINDFRRSLAEIERFVPHGSRPLAIVHTKLDEAVMWLGKELQRLDEHFPAQELEQGIEGKQ